MTELKKSFCRICTASCALDVLVEDNRVVSVKGDRTNPMTGGYTCIKGRTLPEQHNLTGRLRHSLRRGPDGTFADIESNRAIAEVAERLQPILETHGPRSIAVYCGTPAYFNPPTLESAYQFTVALGSPSFYTAYTIDQPAKSVAATRHGAWMGGDQSFDSSDVIFVVGANPLVSNSSMGGKFPTFNPFVRLKQAKARGLKVIVVDPRVSELARRADVHLAVKPGEDASLLAGAIRLILDEKLYDQEFVGAHCMGLDELRAAVDEFTPEQVQARTGVAWESIEAAVRVFAAGPRGMAMSATGPSMGPQPNLTEQLVITLNTLLGRYPREGETVANPGVLRPIPPRRAQAVEGRAPIYESARSRFRGLAAVPSPRPFGAMELPTATIAEEILTPGEGQVRALIVVGGNPIAVWPDQAKSIAALESLELSVALDMRLSETAQLCDYVIAPKLSLERSDFTTFTDPFFPEPYAQYTRAMVVPDFDVLDEWQFFYRLCQRMGLQLRLSGVDLNMESEPDREDVLDILHRESRVPLNDIRSHEGGRIYPSFTAVVEPLDTVSAGRFHLASQELAEELEAVLSARVDPIWTHRLIARRTIEVSNSNGRDLPSIRGEMPYNPAFMNPADLDALGIDDDSVITITSKLDSIDAIVRATDDVPRGVISMTHAWGTIGPDRAAIAEYGTSVNRLVNTDQEWAPYTGMPLQSAVPVQVRRANLPS